MYSVQDRRRRLDGYDQTELFALAVGEGAQIMMMTTLLGRLWSPLDLVWEQQPPDVAQRRRKPDPARRYVNPPVKKYERKLVLSDKKGPRWAVRREWM